VSDLSQTWLCVEAHHSPGPDSEKIRRYLLDQKDWLDGVTISGGEPTIACGLVSLAREIVALWVRGQSSHERPPAERSEELLTLESREAGQR
jgi:organic radical activating enzyme